MIVDEFALPGTEEGHYLLEGLARLIERRGVETFVAAPLLLAQPRFFPDAVQPRAEGVATLLRRLLAYAGLEPERLALEIFTERQQNELLKETSPHAGTAAWFLDATDGIYRFGVRESELRHVEALVGVLGHEVAHAYRAHHRLAVRARDTEEQLTDLTTVYLGFGVFTLETSFQFKTGHYSSSGERLLYERQTRGYLRPGQLAFLLGAQLVARRAREDTLFDEVLASLSVNQAAAVKAAVKRLGRDEQALLNRLGLPPPETWPVAHDLADARITLPPAEVVIVDRPKEQRAQAEQQRVGFRIAGSHVAAGTGVGFCAGFVAALLLDLQLTFWPCVLGLSALGFALGRQSASPACSACGHKVQPDAARCHFCRLRLVGDIHDAMERLDAEERYHAGQRAQAAADSATAIDQGPRSCPRCAWIPSADDRWVCGCGHRWHTFETRGRCPGCGKQWEMTSCLRCRERSPHQDWYGRHES